MNEFTGRRILVVEDEYLIVDEIVRALEAIGVVVIGPAASVRQALGLVADAPDIDGAVLDINLQGEMAFPVADVLLESKVPFVFATGYDKDAIPARYAHVRRFEKPIDPVGIVRFLFP